jgi:ABC-type microcin C transport system duplicated ATPase subunit YejF
MRLIRTLFQTVALSLVISAGSLGAARQAADRIAIMVGGHESRDGVMPEDGLKTVRAVLSEFVKRIK